MRRRSRIEPLRRMRLVPRTLAGRGAMRSSGPPHPMMDVGRSSISPFRCLPKRQGCLLQKRDSLSVAHQSRAHGSQFFAVSGKGLIPPSTFGKQTQRSNGIGSLCFLTKR